MKKLLLMLLAVASLAFAGAASAQYAATVPQVYVNPTVDCPVVQEDLRAVLSGAYGVDGLSRPVNANGFPVDTAGNCLIDRPVTQVYYARPSPLYVNFLWTYFAYRWMMPVYRPIFTPGVVILRSRPTGFIVPMRTYVVPTVSPRVSGRYVAPTTTVRPGAAVTVRPGAAAVGPTSTVRPGAPAVAAPNPVRPGAAAPAPAAPPRIAPAARAPAASVFNRGPAAAPQRVAPTRIAPSSSGRSTSSGFRRGR